MLRLTLTGENVYGRMTIPEIRGRLTARKLRKASWANNNLIHRTKNGVYDPITYYHVLDMLLQVEPAADFRTSDLMPHLRQFKPQLVWDATTVGRVINDMAESLKEANDRFVIGFVRRWNGMTYDMPAHPENRILLHNLLDDLAAVARSVVDDELNGRFEKRLNSPMNRCPSVMSLADVTTHLNERAG